MLFVTVGSMADFDSLVEAIDKIAPKLNEKVIIQLGIGKYIPKNCEYFRYSSNFNHYIKNADLIISHGGAGSLFEMLELRKSVIGVENIDVNGSHQWDILRKLDDEKYLIWCKDIKNLEKCIIKAKKTKFKKYVSPKCTIQTEIINFMEKHK